MHFPVSQKIRADSSEVDLDLKDSMVTQVLTMPAWVEYWKQYSPTSVCLPFLIIKIFQLSIPLNTTHEY